MKKLALLVGILVIMLGFMAPVAVSAQVFTDGNILVQSQV